jgi:glutaconate CoA-transferase subunit A
VTRYVENGATVYIGNFGCQLFAVGHELIRQERRRLHVVMGSGGILLDQLIAAEAIGTATFSHCWNPIGPTPAHAFRRAVQAAGTGIALVELSMASIGAALLAGAWGSPFMPVPDLSDTSYVAENASAGRLQVATSAFGSQLVVRAIVPDVAFIYADAIDAAGNASITTPLGDCLIAAQAARTVVVIAEEAVPIGQVNPATCVIPGLLVTAFAIAPGAVQPDGSPGRYARDLEEYRSYGRMSATVDGTRAWLDEHIFHRDAGQEEDR